MKRTSNRLMLMRLSGMLVACWGVPPLLARLAGPVPGALASVGAAGLWFWQYRFPIFQTGGGFTFWFVAGGYGVTGLTLLVCLGRLLR
jgi:hypothetical protein